MRIYLILIVMILTAEAYNPYEKKEETNNGFNPFKQEKEETNNGFNPFKQEKKEMNKKEADNTYSKTEQKDNFNELVKDMQNGETEDLEYEKKKALKGLPIKSYVMKNCIKKAKNKERIKECKEDSRGFFD